MCTPNATFSHLWSLDFVECFEEYHSSAADHSLRNTGIEKIKIKKLCIIVLIIISQSAEPSVFVVCTWTKPLFETSVRCDMRRTNLPVPGIRARNVYEIIPSSLANMRTYERALNTQAHIIHPGLTRLYLSTALQRF